MEAVPTGSEVAVEYLASCPRVLPFLIAPVEFISELELLRDGEAQSRVANFDVAAMRREPNESADRIRVPIGTDVLDIYRRSNVVLPQTIRIDHLQYGIIY